MARWRNSRYHEEDDDEVIDETLIQILHHADGSTTTIINGGNGLGYSFFGWVAIILMPSLLLGVIGLAVAIPTLILSGIIDALLPVIEFLLIPAIVLATYLIHRMVNIIYAMKVKKLDKKSEFKLYGVLLVITSFFIFYPFFQDDLMKYAEHMADIERARRSVEGADKGIGASLIHLIKVTGVYLFRIFGPSLILPLSLILIMPLFGRFMVGKDYKSFLTQSFKKRVSKG